MIKLRIFLCFSILLLFIPISGLGKQKAAASKSMETNECPQPEINSIDFVEDDSLFLSITEILDQESHEYKKAALHVLQIKEFADKIQQSENEDQADYWRHGIQQSLEYFYEIGLEPETARRFLEETVYSIEASDQEYYTADKPPFDVAENPPNDGGPENEIPGISGESPSMGTIFEPSPDLPTSYEESLEYETQELDTAEFRKKGFDPITGAKLSEEGDHDEK